MQELFVNCAASSGSNHENSSEPDLSHCPGTVRILQQCLEEKSRSFQERGADSLGTCAIFDPLVKKRRNHAMRGPVDSRKGDQIDQLSRLVFEKEFGNLEQELLR